MAAVPRPARPAAAPGAGILASLWPFGPVWRPAAYLAATAIFGAAAECGALESIVVRSGIEVYGRARGALTRPSESVRTDPTSYPDENPPAGRILCADKGHALVRDALDGLPTKVMAVNYRTVLPDAELLQKELENTRRLLESRGAAFAQK